MAKMRGSIKVESDRCKGCGLCASICPTGAIVIGSKVNNKGYCFAVASPVNECIACAGCGLICPDSCITVYREKE